jgi:hypothetical protein
MSLRFLLKTALCVTVGWLLATPGIAGPASSGKPLTLEDTLIIKKISVISYKKIVDGKKSSASPEDEQACTPWNLTEKQIEEVLRESRFINDHIFHYDFSVLRCRYEGEL